MESIASPIRPSRRSSHDTWEPRPGGAPKASTSKTPPSDSLALRRTLISSTMPRDAGVARAREVDLRHVGLHRPRVHPLLPVGEVTVGHRQGDRPAQGAAVAHTGGDLGGVALDLHAPAAAVAELAPGHVAADRPEVE